ncbi:MAG: tyrosine--tRNA ligase [Clostridia bacterium]|nr:tyrosine--tRNA ligase [Clostridia bacterium]
MFRVDADPGRRREALAQAEALCRGAAQVVSPDELVDRIDRALAERRPLRVKLGADPSAPDIHLGHVVILRKLRQFQDFGHEVHFIVGDFTGQVGDPTGRNEARPVLTREEVMQNARTYESQVFRILDRERTVVEFNSRWLAPLTFAEVAHLAGAVTVARLLERDDFAKRFAEGRPISLHEFLYPLMQGYDSVAIRADVELGGTDQTFNILTARQIQRHFGQEPEIMLAMPILVGLDGVQKMSKSLGNYIAVEDPPDEVYGKAMSIGDELIVPYLTLLTDVPAGQVERWAEDMRAGRVNPRDVKMRLARELVALLWGPGEAERAEERFRAVFQRREAPADAPMVALRPGATAVEALLAAGFARSRGEARRLVEQGGVRVAGVRVARADEALAFEEGDVLEVGRRRFARLTRA